MNVVLWRALLAARAAEATARLRKQIKAASEAPENERERLLLEALDTVADAIDELTNMMELERERVTS